VAHSLGGLIARYAIAELYMPEMVSNSSLCEELHPKGTIAGLEPINFITSATPHLGSRGSKQVFHTYLYYLADKLQFASSFVLLGMVDSSGFTQETIEYSCIYQYLIEQYLL
jgi:Putative serine esterase (DUF676)